MSEHLIKTDGLAAFKERVLHHARALDHGRTLPSETTVCFASVHEMLQVLTPRRLALLETLTLSGSRPVNLLAKDLRRKRESVMRDIGVLKKIGVVSTEYDKARVFTAKPMATRYDFICSISGRSHSRNSKAA